MSQLEFRVRAADDPLGALLTTLDYRHLLPGSGFRGAKIGTGSGQIIVPADIDEAEFLHDKAHIQVVDNTLGDGTTPEEGLLGSFFLNDGDAKVLSEGPNRRALKWGGEGSLSILARAILAKEFYAPGQTARGSSSGVDGSWFWTTEPMGAILRRAYEEGVYQPGTPLAVVSADFDRDEDSNGVPWSLPTMDITRKWGTNALELFADFMKLGLTVQMAGTLLLSVYESYGTDRSGDDFGAGVVRFQGRRNIAADLARAIRSKATVSHLFVRGSDTATVVVEDPTVTPKAWDVLDYSESDDVDVLTAAGERNLALRRLQTDVPRFPIPTGFDEDTGLYTPGPPGSPGHFWYGDTVRLHTKAGQHHYDEVDFPVAAISWSLKSGRKWEVTLDLGSTYLDRQSRQFEEQVWSIVHNTTPGPHSHPEMLCEATVEPTADTLLYHLHWNGSVQEVVSIYPSGTDNWPFNAAGVVSTPGSDGVAGCIEMKLSRTGTGSPKLPATAGQTYRYEFDTKYGGGWDLVFYNASNVVLQSERMATHTSGNVWVPRTWTSVAPTNTAYMLMVPIGAGYYDHVRIYGVTGTPGSNPRAGTSMKFSRCDHEHDAAEIVFDDDVNLEDWRDVVDDHGHLLIDLADLDTTGLADGYTIFYDASTETFYVGPAAGGVTDHGGLTGLSDDDHPQYALDTDLTTHAGAADPHTGYQKESEKGAANGYASLGADTLVPQDQLGTGVQNGLKFLRDDGVWATPTVAQTLYEPLTSEASPSFEPVYTADGRFIMTPVAD